MNMAFKLFQRNTPPTCLSFEVNDTDICWKTDRRNDQHGVLFTDVINVTDVGSDADSFCLHYARCEQKNKLRKRSIVVQCSDNVAKENYVRLIKDKLCSLTHRPQRLLVFVNPDSGKKQGRQVFEKEVSPLFDLADIKNEVIITKRGGEALDTIGEYDLSTVDAVIAVGGDGSYHEVAHGMLNATIKNDGGDISNPPEDLPETRIRMGYIPAGTGNGMATATTGTLDVMTSALHIVLGHFISLDVGTVYQKEKFLAYCVVLVGSGGFSDVFYESEKRRNMGRMRHLYAMIRGLFKYRTFPAKIECLLVDEHVDKEKKQLNDVTDDALSVEHKDKPESEHTTITDNTAADALSAECQQTLESTRTSLNNEWVSYDDEYSFILGLMYSFDQPANSNKDTSALYYDLLRKCSYGRRHNLKYLFKKLALRNAGEVTDCHLTRKLQEFRLRVPTEGAYVPTELDHIVNIDGEVYRLESPPAYTVKKHSKKIQVFGCEVGASSV